MPLFPRQTIHNTSPIRFVFPKSRQSFQENISRDIPVSAHKKKIEEKKIFSRKKKKRIKNPNER